VSSNDNLTANAYILAAGSLNSAKIVSSAWVLETGMSVLDWQAQCLKEIQGNVELTIAVGCDVHKFAGNNVGHNFSYVSDWENGTALQSFLSVIHGFDHTAIVMYGDTVFHAHTIKSFASIDADVVVGVDSNWRQRFGSRPFDDMRDAETIELADGAEVEYTGLLKLSPKVLVWLSQRLERYNTTQSFTDLLKDLHKNNFKLEFFDVEGAWAEMNYPSDLAQFILGSKAETLKRLSTKIKKSLILDQITILKSDFELRTAETILAVQNKFGRRQLVVRSSSKDEDGWGSANAGVFDSYLDIAADQPEELINAIASVFKSYKSNDPNAEVLIQPFLKDITISGVVFTCDLVTGAPYYVINYDDTTSRTDVVTSGGAADTRTIVMLRNNLDQLNSLDPRLIQLIEATQELENILGYKKLDIEFALDSSGNCVIFQVRPITVKHEINFSDNEFNENITASISKFKRLQAKPDHIFGATTVFSRMSDWNPAEIVGSRPNPLAFSLYNHMITEEVWNKQRSEFGYRDVFPSVLVFSFCSQPYVDCRATINSFIPKALPDETADRLVNAYMSILTNKPELHDKIELDVIFTIWTPTFLSDAKERFSNLEVTEQDISYLEQALKPITATAITRLLTDIASINTLDSRCKSLITSNLAPIDKIYQLIEDTKKFGTLAFAHAARAGFVAITILKSMVKAGVICEKRMLLFQSTIATVTTDLQRELAENKLNFDQLINDYGHLRPGTYDITQKAYWERPDFYFRKSANKDDILKHKPIAFSFTNQEEQALQEFLNSISLEIWPSELISYLKQAIQAREKTKLEFTRNLSKAFDLLITYGNDELGMCRSQLGFLTFDDIKCIKNGQLDSAALAQIATIRKQLFDFGQLVKLPSLIKNEHDFLAFEDMTSKPNFITRENTVSPLAFVSHTTDINLDGKIAAISSADPGYDWIFSHQISGLITEFGGANSHMAIRCAELNIPAAIGVGSKVYGELKENLLLLDCQKELLKNVE
jgi:glutamine kinase